MKRESIGRAVTEAPSYRWWVFGAVALPTLIAVLDEISFFIALPRIGTHFDVDLTTIQWLVVGYILAISVFLLPIGLLGDIIGRKQVFVAGLATFLVGAFLGGLAASIAVLILSRVLLGVSAAVIQSNGIAIITSAFPRREWGKVMGYRLGIVGAGAIVGPVIGGFLVTTYGWRSIFFLGIALEAIALIIAVTLLDKVRLAQDTQVGQRPKFDWPGVAFLAGALLAFLLALTSGSRIGWGSPIITAGILAAAALVAAFIWWELRTPLPMLDLRLFRRRLVGLGVSSAWILFFGVFQTHFMMTFYIQDVLGYSPQMAGLIIIPSFLGITIMDPLGGRLSDRYGWRRFNIAGMALCAVSLFVFATTLTESSSLALIIPVLLLQSCGIGLFDSANNSAILSAVERSKLGVVGALTQLTRNSAGVTSVAVSTAIVVATMSSLGVEPTLECGRGWEGSGPRLRLGAAPVLHANGIPDACGDGAILLEGRQPQDTARTNALITYYP